MPYFRRTCGLVAAIAVIAPSLAFAIGSTPVTVVNPTDIAKAQGIQQPYQATVFCATAGVGCSGDLQLASGQRLVIEYVSGHCGIDNRSLLAEIYVTTVSNGAIANHFISLTDKRGVPISAATNDADFGRTVRFYADAGSVMRVQAIVGGSVTTGAFCFFNISGQSVSVP